MIRRRWSAVFASLWSHLSTTYHYHIVGTLIFGEDWKSGRSEPSQWFKNASTVQSKCVSWSEVHYIYQVKKSEPFFKEMCSGKWLRILSLNKYPLHVILGLIWNYLKCLFGGMNFEFSVWFLNEYFHYLDILKKSVKYRGFNNLEQLHQVCFWIL